MFESNVNISQSSTEIMSKMLHSRGTTEVVIETMFSLAINLLALVGNILVCWIICRNPRFHTVTNTYVLSLAISDVAMATLCMPLVVGVLIEGKWPYGPITCQFQGYLILYLAYVSLQTIALVAVNRYHRVNRPDLFKRLYTKKFTVGSIISVCVFAALILALPMVSGWAEYTFHPGKLTCALDFSNSTADLLYTTILGGVMVLLPLVTIIYCYSKVFMKVKQHRHQLACSSRETGNRLSVDEVNLTKTLFAIVLAFILCWVPVFIMESVDAFSGNNSLPRVAYLVFNFLVCISSATNPAIYGVFNKQFRKEYLKTFSFYRKKKSIKIGNGNQSHGNVVKANNIQAGILLQDFELLSFSEK